VLRAFGGSDPFSSGLAAQMDWSLRFEGGTLVLDGPGPDALPEGFTWDPRIGRARGPASRYGALVEELRAGSVTLEDRAKAWNKLDSMRHLSTRTARAYQEEAVTAWRQARWRGVVVLPTGAGKSYVAERIIAECRRSTLVVVPTLDLLSQWYGGLRAAFGDEVGALGGGSHDIRDITVTTYDSCAIYAERYGDRFGLVIWDEVHHLPAPGYCRAAAALCAPLRLGLTATLERTDGSHEVLDHVVGPVVYRREIPELAGDYLADYTTEVITVRLSDAEKARYDALRAQYATFCSDQGLRIRSPQDWQHFIQVSARSKAGRSAFKAYLEARRIAHGGERKIEVVREIVTQEWGRRTIVFTNDNATAYKISEDLLVPCITHHTDVKERRRWLDAFTAGDITVLTTSRVLNEGVDLPEAEVAIIVSGTSTVRESVQRLGRILRPGVGKEAVLYELVAEGTTETRASERRREHDAYR
jgi:superfamily II DNA or RNA helicase